MIHHGDLFDVLPTLEAESIDACVTDPPYELAFMGKTWDQRGVAFDKATWEAVWRVLKPGAHLLAFGGPRTYHRMTCAIEDAGFEIRDCLQWIYGSGFPKSLDVSKAIDRIKDRSLLLKLNSEIRRARAAAGMSLSEIGERMMAATAGRYGKWYHRGGHMFFETGMSLPSRPEWAELRAVLPIAAEYQDVYESAEREVIGRSENGIAGGTGRHVGEDCAYGFAREYDLTKAATAAAKQWHGWGTALKPACEPIVLARKPLRGSVAENVERYGTGALNIDACRIDLDGVPKTSGGCAGVSRLHGGGITVRATEDNSLGRWPANVVLDEIAAIALDEMSGELGVSAGGSRGGSRVAAFGMGAVDEPQGFGDTGGASRFFYCAKPSREERDMGCYGLPSRQRDESRKEGNPGGDNPRNRGLQPRGNHHPTVKPVELMRWLVRLVTPPSGTVLDPFLGSGTTGMACRYELRPFIGIEREAEYVAIAERRIASVAPLFVEPTQAAQAEPETENLGLQFDDGNAA